MNTQKPVLDEKKITAFLENAVKPSSKGKCGKISERAPDIRKSSMPGKAATRRNMPRHSKTIKKLTGKFQVEMTTELRRTIKYISVADDVSMNDLIVSALEKYFK